MQISSQLAFDICNLGHNVNSKDDIPIIRTKILDILVKELSVTGGFISEYNHLNKHYLVVSTSDNKIKSIGDKIILNDDVMPNITNSDPPFTLDIDALVDINQHSKNNDACSLHWPIFLGDELYGLVSVTRKRNMQFTADEWEYGANIVRFIALTLDNANFRIQSYQQSIKHNQMNRQQVKWSEALSWLNSVHLEIVDNNDIYEFYKIALFQSILLTNTLWGQILISQDGLIQDVIQCKDGFTQCDNLSSLYNEMEMKSLFSTQEFVLSNQGDPITLRIDEINGQRNGSYILTRLQIEGVVSLVIILCASDESPSINQIDLLTFKVFIDGLIKVIDRRELLKTLKANKTELEKEKEEQQVLIKQLAEAHNKLLQSEKMASIGQLAAGVAHEINNPVGYISSNISSLKLYIDDMLSLLGLYADLENNAGNSQQTADQIKSFKSQIDFDYMIQDLHDLTSESLEGVSRVKQIVQDLKDFSHVDEAEWQSVNIHKGIDSTLNVVNNEIKYKADVIKDYSVLPDIECIPSQLNQVFLNLLVNAAHSIGSDRGKITIRTRQDEDRVIIEIEDTGRGIDPDHINKIFDPFFTTKPVGQGTGLGLSLSYGIIEKHNGHIHVDSQIGKGTKFSIHLPVKSSVNDIGIT